MGAGMSASKQEAKSNICISIDLHCGEVQRDYPRLFFDCNSCFWSSLRQIEHKF